MITTDFEHTLAAAISLAERIRALGESEPPEAAQEDTRRRKITAVAEAITRCRDEAFDVAVVGEMKAGKSTLLNALVFGRELLPAATTVCTAKLATVEYAESFEGMATFVDRATFEAWEHDLRDLGSAAKLTAERRALEELVRDARAIGPELGSLLGQTRRFAEHELVDYMAVDGRLTPVVREIRLSVKHPLGPKVRLVDTPGLWDPDRSRSKLTIDYLHRASVVIVVMYAGAPMSEQDYDMIARLLMGAGLDRILVVLNKMDTVQAGKESAVVEYVDAKLRDIRATHTATALASALANAQALPVSGLLGLVAATRGGCTDGAFHEDLLTERYGFETYEQAWSLSGLQPLSTAIRELIANRDGRARIGSVIQKGRALLDDVRRTADQRVAEANRSLADLDKGAEALRRQSEDLNDGVRRLKDGLGGAQAEVNRRLTDVRPTARRLNEAVGGSLSLMQAEGERQIAQLGWSDAFSDAQVMKLNTELGWKARDADGKMRHVFERYVNDVATELPDAFRKLRERLGAALSPELQFHVDRLQFVTSIGSPDFKPGPPPEIDPVGFWRTFFKPGKAREGLRSALQNVLTKWEQDAIAVATKTEADFTAQLKSEWVDSAFKALQQGLERQQEELRRSSAAVAGSLAEREKRRAELVTRRQVSAAALEGAARLLTSLAELETAAGVAHA